MSLAIERLVIAKLSRGPCYARSFQHVKPVLNRLIASGRVQRVAPPGSRSKNMVALVEPK